MSVRLGALLSETFRRLRSRAHDSKRLTAFDLRGKSDEELIDLLGLCGSDTPQAEQIKQVIQLRYANREAESATRMVTATKSLVKATVIIGVTTIVFAGIQAFVGITSLLQQSTQRFAAYRGSLDVQSVAAEIRTGATSYIRVPLELKNAGDREMTRLYVIYSHWDGASWLGVLAWSRNGKVIPPTTIPGHQSIRAWVGAETRSDVRKFLERGDRLYFAARATWTDPNGRTRCSTFFVQIFQTVTGESAPGGRITTPVILYTLPPDLRPPPNILVCQEAP